MSQDDNIRLGLDLDLVIDFGGEQWLCLVMDKLLFMNTCTCFAHLLMPIYHREHGQLCNRTKKERHREASPETEETPPGMERQKVSQGEGNDIVRNEIIQAATFCMPSPRMTPPQTPVRPSAI